MKFYDKEINKKAEKIKETIIIILVFFLGYVVGNIAINLEQKNKNIELEKINYERQQHIIDLERLLEEKEVKINEQFVEIDALKETIYMLNMYGE